MSPATMTAQDLPARRIFLLSCIALTVTAMTFAIRAGMMVTLGGEFELTGREVGIAAAMFGYGFPLATVFGGLIYNRVGPRKIMILAFVGQLLGLAPWMLSGGFALFAFSTFLIGFANGSVEAACNPMIAEMYPEKKTTVLNRFHVWFPGGLGNWGIGGIFLLSIASGSMTYVAAIVFAIGICYFWPTMVGYTGENIARTGALGLSLVGAAGMYALTFWNPVIGGWIDAAREKANAAGVAGVEADVVAGQAALSNLLYFPLVLIVCFFALWLLRNAVRRTAGDGDIVPETAPAE